MSLRSRITASVSRAAGVAVRALQGAARSALGIPAEMPGTRTARRDRGGRREKFATMPLTAQGSQPRVPVLDEWDVVDVRDALRTHEEGIFRDSALLADHMSRQDRITGVLDTRINAVLGMPFDVLAADTGDTAKAAAALLKRRWSRMVTRGHRAASARWLVMMGFVVCHRIWERDPRTGLWDVRLQPWHPTWVHWDHARGVYRVTTLGGVEECPPDGSNLRWCVIPLLDEDRPWMQGAIRRLAIPFLIISWAYRDWARWSEKHGLPPLGARVPNEERFRQATDQFLDDLQQLASEPTILLPLGPDGKPAFDLEWKELKNWQSYQGFKDLASQQETNVAIALLGQNLSTEVQGGSYAAAQAHMLVRRDFLVGTAQPLDDGERRFVAVPWMQVNVEADPIAAEELAPRPTTDTNPPLDEKAEAETSKAKAEATKAWRDAGADVDVEAEAKASGVKLRAAPTKDPVTGAKGGPAKYDHISFRPPKGAREAARRALEVRATKPPSERGMTDVGIARARDLSNGRSLSPETVREMLGFFVRHEVDKTGDTWDEHGKGWQAWNGWGGDAGYAWSRKVVRQMDAADAEES